MSIFEKISQAFFCRLDALIAKHSVILSDRLFAVIDQQHDLSSQLEKLNTDSREIAFGIAELVSENKKISEGVASYGLKLVDALARFESVQQDTAGQIGRGCTRLGEGAMGLAQAAHQAEEQLIRLYDHRRDVMTTLVEALGRMEANQRDMSALLEKLDILPKGTVQTVFRHMINAPVKSEREPQEFTYDKRQHQGN